MRYKLSVVSAILTGSLVGYFAWRPPDLFVLLWLLPVAWAVLPRFPRAVMMMSYTTVALSTIPPAVGNYFPAHAHLYGYGVWLANALLAALPWVVASRFRRHTGWVWAIATLVEAVPPFGIIGMASPLFAATAAFPGLGLVGLLMTLGLQGWIAGSGQHRHLGPVMLLTAMTALVININYTPVYHSPHWSALATRLGPDPHTPKKWLNRQLDLRKLIQQRLLYIPHDSVLLTPEDIAGTWSAFSPLTWSSIAREARKRGDTVLLGAVLPLPNGHKLDSLLSLGANQGVYDARQPLPLTEWNPLSKKDYPAHWFRFGPAIVAHRHAAFAVCYEQLLVWPLAWAFMGPHRPRVILAASNHGWATPGETEIAVQHQAARAWGRLYGVPVLLADNRPT